MGGIRMNGLILAGANSSRSVPRQNRVYDLRPEPADGEIFDRSRNGNNAILSTGWAVTLDGITGHMQVDFATQQNVTVLTARVRSSTDTTFYAGTENASGTDTIVANDTWQDVSVTISDAVADELFVGSDDGSTNFFAGDICDVRVASVGTWYLNDHPAGSLDGLPAFDSSGNGNDGVHVGGTSIVGEGMPDSVAKLGDADLQSLLSLDGVDDNIQLDADVDYGSAPFDVTVVATIGEDGIGAVLGGTGAGDNRWTFRQDGLTNWTLRERTSGTTRGAAFDSALIIGETYTFNLSRSGDVVTMSVDGVTQTGTATVASGEELGWNEIGARSNGTLDFFKGTIHSISDSLGTAWDGTQADAIAQGWTVSGSPATVADLRRTIPQTALQDWNAGYITNTSNYYDLGNLAGFNVGTNDFSFGFGCLVKTDIQYEIFTKFNTTGGASFRVFRRPTTGALVVSTYSDGTTGSLTGGDSVPGALPIGKVVNFEFIKSGTSFVIYKNGAIFDTLTVGADVFNSTTKLQVNARDGLAAAAGLFMFDVWFKNNGTEIVRVPLVGNPAPDLTGATMVGTPDSVYLPEASDNPGFDVLGNAIANPRSGLLNPRGETGDSITILEDATLGAMKTWAMIVNYDGEDQTLLDLGTPEITVASDTIATSGITSPTIYVDGVATTTLTTGRHLIVVTTETATDCGPITCSNLIQNGKDVGYDTNPLSASGVSQLYRALRRYL
jgi:hypothetical protein